MGLTVGPRMRAQGVHNHRTLAHEMITPAATGCLWNRMEFVLLSRNGEISEPYKLLFLLFVDKHWVFISS